MTLQSLIAFLQNDEQPVVSDPPTAPFSNANVLAKISQFARSLTSNLFALQALEEKVEFFETEAAQGRYPQDITSHLKKLTIAEPTPAHLNLLESTKCSLLQFKKEQFAQKKEALQVKQESQYSTFIEYFKALLQRAGIALFISDRLVYSTLSSYIKIYYREFCLQFAHTQLIHAEKKLRKAQQLAAKKRTQVPMTPEERFEKLEKQMRQLQRPKSKNKTPQSKKQQSKNKPKTQNKRKQKKNNSRNTSDF